MPSFQCDFRSDVLELATSMNVILPDPAVDTPGGRHKVMWLLHGLSDDHTIWSRRTSIERYADFHQMAIVMPAAHRSMYADMAIGFDYWQHISEEVPRLARRWFPLSDKREHNFVAGLSMGGYGAFKHALTHPDRYAAAASLSGVLDMVSRWDGGANDRKSVMVQAFGNPPAIEGTAADLMHLASKVVASGEPIPRLYACCGTEDFLLDGNRRFEQHAAEVGLNITFEYHDGFGHTWDYWDQQIAHVFQWIKQGAKSDRQSRK
jgi:putative tributyrin esterase